jgi:hypothetical protein
MIISQMEIRLSAGIARLQQDLDAARRAVGGTMDRISASVAGAMKMFAGLAAGFSVAALAGFVKSSIDAVDALNDLSVRSRVAIEDLAGLAYGAKLSDTTLEGVADSITKLGQNIGKDGAKFRALGITAKEPLEAYKQLADIFKDIQDPQQRAAFGAEALGKTWQSSAVLLESGAEGIAALIDEGKALSGVTEQVAADAGRFNDKIDEMGFIVRGVGTRIAADLLPMLNLLVQDMSATGDEVDSAVEKFNPLTEVLRVLIILGGNVGFVLKGIASEIGTWAQQIGEYYSAIGQFIGLDFSGGWATLKATFGKGGIGDQAAASAADAREAFDKWEASWVNVGTAADRESKRAEAAGNDMADALIKNFTGAGKAAGDSSAKVAAFLNSSEVNGARQKAADSTASAAAKEQSAYAGLIASIKEKMAASRAEIAGAGSLTAAQQIRIKLDEELAAGKVTLTDKHLKEVRALIDNAEALEKNASAAKQVREAVAALADERDKNYESLVAEAVANEKLVETFGKTKKQIEMMTLARDEDRLAQRASLELDEKAVAQLEREIEARKRGVVALGTLDVLEQQKKATDDAAAAQSEFWKSIDETAHATFVSIANGSKDAAQRLKDTFKNVFFDWLYQQTIKKWFINVGLVGTTSVAGAAESAAGGSAGGLGSLINAGKSIYEGFASGFAGAGATLGGYVTTLGNLFGSSATSAFGAGLSMSSTQAATAAAAYNGAGMAGTGSAINAGAAAAPYASLAAGAAVGFFGGNLISGQYGSKATTALGTAIGAVIAGPLGAAIGGLLGGVANRAFGMGDKKVTGQSIEGMLTPTGATGNNLSSWTQKGGWFRSDKSDTTPTALSGEQSALFTTAYKGILDLSKTFGDALGVETSALSTRLQKLSIDFKGLTTDAEKGAAVTKFFEGVANTVAAELVPSIAKFAAEGEAASATLVRLATDYRNVDDIFAAIGATIKQTGLAGIEMREGLISAAGGLDALAAGVGYVQQNFISEADRLVQAQKQLADGLSGIGYSALKTKDDFKAAVQGFDWTREGAAGLFVQLLALAPAFKEVTDAADAAAKVASEAAQVASEAVKQAAIVAAQAAKDMAATLLSNVDEAFAVLQRVVDREKAINAQAHAAEMKAMQARIDISTSSITKLKSLSDSLKSSLDAMSISGTGDSDARTVGQAQIRAALAIVKAGGPLPTADSLKEALSSITKDASDQFATYDEYLTDFYKTQNDIAALGKVSDAALSVEQKTLDLLQAQKDASQVAYDAELARLNDLVETTRSQIDVLKGMDTSLLTINQSLQAVLSAIVQARANPIVSAPAGITQSYQDALGRAPDKAGMEFWQQQAANGSSLGDIDGLIKGSAEAQVQKLYKELLGRSADGTGMDYWSSLMNSGTSVDSIRAAIKADSEYKSLHPFAVGTNFVPRDMPAYIHEGEAIIPAADNRELMSRLSAPAANNSAELIAELRAQRDEQRVENEKLLKVVESHLYAIAKSAKNTEDFLDGAVNGGAPIATKAEGPA